MCTAQYAGGYMNSFSDIQWPLRIEKSPFDADCLNNEIYAKNVIIKLPRPF